MIRLCALLPAPDPEATLRMAERLGVWGTGLQLAPEATEAGAAAAGRRFRDAGLHLVQLADDRNVSTPVEEVRRGAAEHLRRSLALASAAGALAVCTGAGHCDPARPEQPFAAHPANMGAEALDRLALTCREALQGQGGGARLLVEPGVLGPLHSLLRASEAVRRVADSRFGILFDPVNLMNLDTYFDNGSFLRRCVQQLGPAIGLVHAKDALLHPERFTFQLAEEPVGQGALDYPALLQALAALPGDVPLCVEHVGSEEAAAAALGHLRAVAQRAGLPLGGRA